MGTPAEPRGSVLVVDDYGPFREMLQHALELAGYLAVAAGTGSGALASAVACGRVDVALVDLGLPDRPGVEIADELVRKGLAGRAVLMSGLPADDLVWPEGWTGEREVLLKPYGLDELLDRIAAAVGAVRREAAEASSGEPARRASEGQ